MKITKKQLRRLIREEKRKILKESITDMRSVEDAVVSASDAVADVFAEQMEKLFTEDPEMFEGRSTKEEWDAQVAAASESLRYELTDEIDALVQRAEGELHSGNYHPGQPGPGRNRPR